MLLALDLASTVGWAWGKPAQPRPAKYGATRFGGVGVPAGHVFDRFDEWLWDIIETVRPNHVFAESPFVAPKTNAHVVQILYGLKALVMRACYREGIILRFVTPLEANRAFVGHLPRIMASPGETRTHLAARRREEKKSATIKMAGLSGCPTESDDAADAIAVWVFGRCVLQRQPSVPIPKFPVQAH